MTLGQQIDRLIKPIMNGDMDWAEATLTNGEGEVHVTAYSLSPKSVVLKEWENIRIDIRRIK